MRLRIERLSSMHGRWMNDLAEAYLDKEKRTLQRRLLKRGGDLIYADWKDRAMSRLSIQRSTCHRIYFKKRRQVVQSMLNQTTRSYSDVARPEIGFFFGLRERGSCL